MNTLIISGVEISAAEGEIILLGVGQSLSKLRTVRSIVVYFKTENALAVAPHSFRGYGLGDLAAKLDLGAVEALNSITSLHQNRIAKEPVKARCVASVTGSDSLYYHNSWNVYSEIQASINVEVLYATSKGNVTVSSVAGSIRF